MADDIDIGSLIKAVTGDDTEAPEEAEASAPEEGAEDGDQTEEQPDGEKPAEEKTSEEWTKEAAEKARVELEEQQKDVARQYRDLQKKSRKFNERLISARAERERVENLKKQVDADVGILLKGTTREVLAKLSQLTGRDAIEFYKELGQVLATDGKSARDREQKPKVDEEQKKRLEALEQAEAARRISAANSQIISGVFSELSTTVIDEGRFPALAEYAKDAEFTGKDGRVRKGPQAAALELLDSMFRLYSQGRTLTVEEACEIADRRLSSFRTGPDTSASAKTGTPGPGTGAATTAEDRVAAQREPVGVSISSAAATSPSSRKRPLTEAERQKLAAQMVSEMLPPELR